MRIALCSYSQKEKETALLMKLGKVDRFDNGVFCTYAMQRDGPYDAVVVMEDGARGDEFLHEHTRLQQGCPAPLDQRPGRV